MAERYRILCDISPKLSTDKVSASTRIYIDTVWRRQEQRSRSRRSKANDQQGQGHHKGWDAERRAGRRDEANVGVSLSHELTWLRDIARVT
ncbi:hypothetical protein ACHWQZ_G009779 [Mnemiopsis leidyi]